MNFNTCTCAWYNNKTVDFKTGVVMVTSDLRKSHQQ